MIVLKLKFCCLQIDMTNFNNDTQWDFKFVHSVSEIKQLKCCPNKSYPTITYNFLLTRHYDINHISHVIPTIGEYTHSYVYFNLFA